MIVVLIFSHVFVWLADIILLGKMKARENAQSLPSFVSPWDTKTPDGIIWMFPTVLEILFCGIPFLNMIFLFCTCIPASLATDAELKQMEAAAKAEDKRSMKAVLGPPSNGPFG